jgi:hypothetical protein
MFSALAENLDFFRAHMNVFIALAPVVRVDNCSSGLIKKMSDSDKLEKMIVKMGVQEVFPSSKNRKAQAFFHKILPEISNMGLKLLADDDPREVN